MLRRSATAALTGVVGVLAVALPAAPAHAEGEIGLSRDGRSWSDDLPGPLFDPALRWVPGDARTASFLVRNQGPSAGDLTASVRADDASGLLASPDFALEARVDDGPWVEVADGLTQIVADRVVARGAISTVQVRGTFAAAATGSQQLSVPFRVEIGLAEDGAVAGAEDDAGTDDGSGSLGDGTVGGEADAGESDDLPSTGATVQPELLWLGAGLVGAGIALVRRGRREATR